MEKARKQKKRRTKLFILVTFLMVFLSLTILASWIVYEYVRTNAPSPPSWLPPEFLYVFCSLGGIYPIITVGIGLYIIIHRKELF